MKHTRNTDLVSKLVASKMFSFILMQKKDFIRDMQSKWLKYKNFFLQNLISLIL